MIKVDIYKRLKLDLSYIDVTEKSLIKYYQILIKIKTV
jgi:hypothetical protein